MNQVEKLMNMVGGKPCLVKNALDSISLRLISFDQFLKTASSGEGIWIYEEHLDSLRQKVQENTKLEAAMRSVVNATGAVPLESAQAQELETMGLVKRQTNNVTISCQLYREYFVRKSCIASSPNLDERWNTAKRINFSHPH